jgi:cell division septal protein FtsQ
VKEFTVENASLLPEEVYRNEALRSLRPDQMKVGDELQKYFLKQPYVNKCELIYTGPNQVKVRLEEKEIVARVFTDDTKYLLSSSGELIEEQQGTTALNLPLICGISYSHKILLEEEQKRITDALAIIAAFDRIDKSITKEISEILWLKENQPAIMLREYSAPFLITVKCIQRQAAYVQALLSDKQRYQNLMASAMYVDMRYDKHIFFGNENNPENK